MTYNCPKCQSPNTKFIDSSRIEGHIIPAPWGHIKILDRHRCGLCNMTFMVPRTEMPHYDIEMEKG